VSARAYRLALAASLPVVLLLGAPVSNGRVAGADAVAAGDPVIVAGGDICWTDQTACEGTATLLDQISPDAVLTLGDNQYDDGALADYNTYYEPHWGRHDFHVHPSPGNHDFHIANAQGYRDYFGAHAPSLTYSFNLGAWHLVSLAGAGIPVSTQNTWLQNDLASNAGKCILAYWHEPRFSSGTTHGSDSSMEPLWTTLYNAHAAIVLNGHEHMYERFAPQSPSGVGDPNGIREFVVGTGGTLGDYPIGTPIANSQVRNNATAGVLRLALHSGSYDWQFVPVAGQTFTDSGSGTCSGAAPSPSPGTTGSNRPSRRYIYNSGADQSGAAQNGWNLLDVGSKSAADALPAGTRGLVWVGDYAKPPDCSWEMSVADLTTEVTDAIGDPKVAGYFFSDEPDPDACPTAVADHKARSALIHSLDPSKFTVMVADMNSDQASLDQIPLWKDAADYIGLDPYPCRPNEPCTFSWIRQVIAAANAAGLRYWGVAQAFNDDNWRWPRPWEESRMLALWAASNQRGYMTFAWTWQNNDLTSQPALLRVLRQYNLGTLPNTRITDAPPSVTTRRRATFRFASSIAGSRFRCKLDRRVWRRCSSPKVYRGLSRGVHTFRVRARVWGRVDPTPAHRSWTIK